METSLLSAMADGEGAGSLNLSPSILSDYTGAKAAGSGEGKRLASACIHSTARPLTPDPVPDCLWVAGKRMQHPP